MSLGLLKFSSAAGTESSPRVLTVRDYFKMLWIYASRNATQVVKRKIFRDWPDFSLVRKSVRAYFVFAVVKLAIAKLKLSSSPYPAAAKAGFVSWDWPMLIYFGPESFDRVCFGS